MVFFAVALDVHHPNSCGTAPTLIVRPVFVVKNVGLDCVSIRIAFHSTFDLFAKLREYANGTIFQLLTDPVATSTTK